VAGINLSDAQWERQDDRRDCQHPETELGK
jgi:hypothetical protein